MYRNTYLQLYKSSASHEQNPTILLNHFSQIYNTLGCVLQDLQYQIGRLQLQNSKIVAVEEDHKENQRSNALKNVKAKKIEKEIVKIEDTVEEQPAKKGRVSDKQSREINTNTRKPQFVEEAIKYEQSQPRIQVSRGNKFSEKPQKEREYEQLRNYNVVEKVRGGVNRQSDSFDQLFGDVQEQKPTKPFQPNLAPIPQNNSQNSNSQPPNTYDDFMDRIFKQTQSRRSK